MVSQLEILYRKNQFLGALIFLSRQVDGDVNQRKRSIYGYDRYGFDSKQKLDGRIDYTLNR
jgi:hypothetical protein